MLKSEMIEMRLRELSMDEITGVAGGDIVVNGSPPSGGDNWWDRLSGFTYDYSSGIFSGTSYFGGGGGGGGGGGVPAAPAEPIMVDTDGDGVPDSPEIVVTAWTMPSGYQWAPDGYGGLSTIAIIGPNGNTVYSPEYMQQICNNWFALNESQTQVGLVGQGVGAIGTVAVNPGAVGFGAFLAGLMQIQQLASPLPDHCTGGGESIFTWQQ